MNRIGSQQPQLLPPQALLKRELPGNSSAAATIVDKISFEASPSRSEELNIAEKPAGLSIADKLAALRINVSEKS